MFESALFLPGEPLATSRLSGVIDASIDRVWSRLADFGGVAGWHPVLSASEIEDEAPTSPGCIRRLTARDGTLFRERLLAVSEGDHRLVYEMIDPPFATARMINGVSLQEITETRQTLVCFGSTYQARDASCAADIDRANTDVFGAGLAGLRAVLGAQPNPGASAPSSDQ